MSEKLVRLELDRYNTSIQYWRIACAIAVSIEIHYGNCANNANGKIDTQLFCKFKGNDLAEKYNLSDHEGFIPFAYNLLCVIGF